MRDIVSSGVCLALPDTSGVPIVGLWVMVAAILAIGGISVAMAVRRWAHREQPPEAFTLQDLRELRARNEISEQEFAALRAALLSQAVPDSLPTSAENADERQPPGSSPK